MLRTLRIAVLVLLLLGARVTSLEAQQYGSLRGTIMDQQGQRLPGATLTLSGIGAERLTVSNEQGEFRYLGLDPGTYSLEARLDGYSTVEQPEIVVALNRATAVDVTLNSAVRDAITVFSEAPLLDERNVALGTVLDAGQLETIPTARDPYSLLSQVPGVLADRVNVGGSESGDPSAFRLGGLGSDDNNWQLDGVQVSVLLYPGEAPFEADFEAIESIEFNTGGPDVTRNTAGASINVVTRRGTNDFRGSARFISGRDDGLGFLGQSSSDLDCADLAETQDCESFTTPSVKRVEEYGFQAGGPVIVDRLWAWGSWGVSDIDRTQVNTDRALVGEHINVKLNGQLGASNSAVASWSNDEKRFTGFGASPGRSPETTWNFGGPTGLLRLEDTHIFGSDLYLTGSYTKVDGGFDLLTEAGCHDASCSPEQEALWDSDGVWRQNFISGVTSFPEETLRLEGSYFFGSGNVGHELKFGARVRESEATSNFLWPGRGVMHIAGENFGSPPGPIDYLIANRASPDWGVDAESTALWLQDTLAAGRWTINAGLRYDLQTGTNRPGTTGQGPFPEILPEITLDAPLDAGFDWETVTPRLGATVALGSDRNTLLRASFSQFPEALSQRDIAWISPIATVYSYAYFLFVDTDDDNLYEEGDPYFFLFGDGYDPLNPAETLNTVDPGFDPELTTEAILGVEHAFLPELVASLSYTYRKIDDIKEVRDYVRPAFAPGPVFQATAADYVPDGFASAELPDGTTAEVPIWALDPSLTFTGFGHLMNGSRSREYNGLSLTFNKRLSHGWSLRGLINWGEAEWDVPADHLANTDRNDLVDQGFGEDSNGALFYERSNPRGRGNIYLQSSWQWNLTGLYQLAPKRPWGFNLSANLYGREGYVVPYYASVIGSDFRARDISLIGAKTDRFRTDNLMTVDLRADKAFSATENLSLNVIVELFNAFNETTVLSRNPNLVGGTADFAQDVLAPRIWRLGVRVSWK
jgi:hypothetical protein